MNREILIIYKSVTGFTAQYARYLAQELDCAAVDLKNSLGNGAVRVQNNNFRRALSRWAC